MELSKRVLEERRIPLSLAWEPVMSREEISVEIAQLEVENELQQAEIEGLGSQLLDVQQECIKLRIELEQLRVEGARADDC